VSPADPLPILGNLAGLLWVVAFHRDAPAVSHQPWLIAVGVGVVANPLPVLAVLTPPDQLLLLD
jgi:hypothetical protein